MVDRRRADKQERAIMKIVKLTGSPTLMPSNGACCVRETMSLRRALSISLCIPSRSWQGEHSLYFSMTTNFKYWVDVEAASNFELNRLSVVQSRNQPFEQLNVHRACSRDVSIRYWQRNPPSTGIAIPVTQPTSSLASITAIRATSVALPTPFKGCTASICWRHSGPDAKSEEVIGVAVTGDLPVSMFVQG
jgi:hypothetical protein